LEEGGPGSGNIGHKGVPGHRGGSLPGGGRGGAAPGDFTTEMGDMMMAGIKDIDDDSPGVKDMICTDISEESGVDYETVNEMAAAWAKTSNDQNMKYLGSQRDAAEEFNKPLSEWQREQIGWAAKTGFTRTIAPADEQRRVLRAMYSQTQNKLADMGMGPDDCVTVYRGFKIPDVAPAIAYKGDTIKLKGNCLESWSLSRRTAETFAAREYGKVAYIVKSRVPRRDIFSTCRTGFGCLEEREVLIFGSKSHDTEVLSAGTAYTW